MKKSSHRYISNPITSRESAGELPKQQNKLSRRPDLNISIAGYIFFIIPINNRNALHPPGGIRSRRYIDNQNRLRTPALVAAAGSEPSTAASETERKRVLIIYIPPAEFLPRKPPKQQLQAVNINLFTITPYTFNIIERSVILREYMNNNILVIKKNP